MAACWRTGCGRGAAGCCERIRAEHQTAPPQHPAGVVLLHQRQGICEGPVPPIRPGTGPARRSARSGASGSAAAGPEIPAQAAASPAEAASGQATAAAAAQAGRAANPPSAAPPSTGVATALANPTATAAGLRLAAPAGHPASAASGFSAAAGAVGSVAPSCPLGPPHPPAGAAAAAAPARANTAQPWESRSGRLGTGGGETPPTGACAASGPAAGGGAALPGSSGAGMGHASRDHRNAAAAPPALSSAAAAPGAAAATAWAAPRRLASRPSPTGNRNPIPPRPANLAGPGWGGRRCAGLRRLRTTAQRRSDQQRRDGASSAPGGKPGRAPPDGCALPLPRLRPGIVTLPPPPQRLRLSPRRCGCCHRSARHPLPPTVVLHDRIDSVPAGSSSASGGCCGAAARAWV